jgi:hypothetical protein
MENNMLKWYGYVLCMEDNRWPKRIKRSHQKEEEEEDLKLIGKE